MESKIKPIQKSRLRLCYFFSFVLIISVQVLFPQKAFSQEIPALEIFVECVEDLGNGRFNAKFGYTATTSFSVNKNKSQLIFNGDKGKEWALNEFTEGTHIGNGLPSKVFVGTDRMKWRVTLGNGEILEAIADKNSKICGLNPYYNPPEGGKIESSSLIGAELTALFEKYISDPDTFNVESDNIFQIKVDSVLIEVRAVGKDVGLLSILEGLGFKLESTSKSSLYLSGWIPINNLLLLNDYGVYLNFARPVYPAITNVGATDTQGDISMRSDYVRQGYPLLGEGVSVGVLSNSYNTLGDDAATDVRNDDLPGIESLGNNKIPVEIVKEYSGVSTDEGRAMLQIVHDIAPQAKLFFRTGFISPGDFADGIRELVDDYKVDILVDDITYITEPFFSDGEVAQAVDYADSMGVPYFVAAGNFASTSYTGSFSPGGTPVGMPSGVVAHNFGGGDIYQSVSLDSGNYTVVLQWDNIGPDATDLDIYLSPEGGTNPLGYNKVNSGDDAIEILPFTVDRDGVNTNIMITKTAGANVPFKYIVFRGYNIFHINEHSQGTSTIVGHANALGALTVGAVRYDDTPAFDNPLKLMSFSSTGGTPINGENELRQKPDFTAPSVVNTTIFMGISTPGNGIFSFSGTSASAPHAAGVAALLMNANNLYNHLDSVVAEPLIPDEIRAKFSATALDMDDSGVDFKSGSGFIQANEAILTIAAPMPKISLLDNKSGVIPGDSRFRLNIKGDYFTEDSEVLFRKKSLPTVYISENELEVYIPKFKGNPPIQVYTPAKSISGLDGGTSDSLLFTDITKKNISVTADTVTKFYGQKIPGYEVSIMVEGANGLETYNAEVDTILLELENAISFDSPVYPGSFPDVGNYVINPFIDPTSDSATMELYNALSELYDFLTEENTPEPLVMFKREEGKGKLTVNKMPVKITPDDLPMMVYGSDISGADVSFTYDIGSSDIVLTSEENIRLL
ncbi:MAG: S8 family serine peptidase, partial [Mariniphaga sp.]|nr:S8 family serine peptidase [Mariniphaga sp.]